MSSQATEAAASPHAFDYSKVNLTTLNAALNEAGIKVTSKTKVEERVRLLQEYELQQCPDDAKLPEEERKLGDCTICNGASQLSRPACPYCGTAEEQPSPVAPVANPKPKSQKAQAKPDKPKPAALAKAGDGKISKKNLDEINGIERRIRGLFADSVEGQWTVGRELASVLKGGQWKYRVGEDGKSPAFKSFGDWVHETFGITPQYARQLVAVSEAYTVKQVREIGVKKLAITLRLPEEARAELVEKAAGGATVREVEAEVQRIAPGATREPVANGSPNARPGAAQQAAAGGRARAAKNEAAKPTRTPKPNEVTAVLALGRYELPMFARAKSAETDEPVRAKAINAGPTAVLEIENSVRIVGKVVEDETGLILVLEFERMKETVAAE